MSATGALLINSAKGPELIGIQKQDKNRAAMLRAHKPLAVLYTAPGHRDFWIASDAGFQQTKAYLTNEGFEGEVVRAHDDDFQKLTRQLVDVLTRSSPPINLMITLGKLSDDIVSAKTLQLLESDNHYRSTIADLLFLKEMHDLNALVHVVREKGNTAPVELPSWLEGVRWLTRKWFGCTTIDSAMTIKMTMPQAVMIELA